MWSWRLSLLLFSAVTLHSCLSDTPESDLQEERSIRDVIDLYNQREGVTYLYKTLEQLPPALLEVKHMAWGPPQKALHESPPKSFIIKETVCLKSEDPDITQCDFMSDGEVKICTLGDEDPEEITCSSLTKNVRVKRAGKKKCKGRSCRILSTGRGSAIAGI
ncbi:cathelicidin-related peptide Oh-Cath-like isoform X1 [Rhinoderma darwinii]|uniref:cathelicidin-related peptide Oh-Cath-like isoform X1 n=1 Tax=Rhinoderma darwinii TaxID=43563 RepID=UPI003F68206A